MKISVRLKAKVSPLLNWGKLIEVRTQFLLNLLCLVVIILTLGFSQLFVNDVSASSNDQLEGKIPKSLGNSSILEILKLNFNQLSGSVPYSFGELSKPTHLDIESNQRQGALPQSLTGFSHINKCDGRSPNGLSLAKQLDLIRRGDGIKWIYQLNTSHWYPMVNVLVQFQCAEDGELVVLATKRGKSRSCTRGYKSADAGLGDKTDEGYLGFRADSSYDLTCSGQSVQQIVYSTLKDRLGFTSLQEAVPDQFTVSEGQYFNFSAELIPMAGCGNDGFQTVFNDGNIHFGMTPDSSDKFKMRVDYVKAEHINYIASGFGTHRLQSGEEAAVAFDSKVIGKDGDWHYHSTRSVLNGKGVRQYHYSNMTFTTRSYSINFGNYRNESPFCGYIKSVIVDPGLPIGSDPLGN